MIRNEVPDFHVWSNEPSRVALIAGRISPEKGTATAIRVARRAGMTPLAVGDAYHREYFEREVVPVLGDGEFVGPVPRRRLSGLMASSAVLLMPIEWEEPFGLVAAEAQMAGCPVVGYRRGALPELVADEIGGYLVDSGDEDALVSAVARSRKLDRWTIRERAQRHLGVESMVDGYEANLASVGTKHVGFASLESQHLEWTGLGPRHSRRAVRHTLQADAVDVGTARK